MYTAGDMVVYGSNGVCRIIGTEVKILDGKGLEYYVLEPVDSDSARFYVPCGNPAALVKLRSLLNRQELDSLLHSVENSGDVWIADENRRKQLYRELIVSGDRVGILSMILALLRHKDSQAKLGRKFHLCDENFLHDAKKLLVSEFSVVLGIPAEEAWAYILDKIWIEK